MVDSSAPARTFRIVVAAHGGLADAMVGTADTIVGGAPGVTALGLDWSESPDAFASRVDETLGAEESPTLLLTDLTGGSPHNVLLGATRRPATRCIGGANLAVLLEAMTSREPLSDELVERLVRLGRDGLVPVAARG